MAVMTWQCVLLCPQRSRFCFPNRSSLKYRTEDFQVKRETEVFKLESFSGQRSARWLVALALLASPRSVKMIDDQQLGFLANFLGIFIFALVIAYHYVTADPNYEGN
ncbi:Oligosaccaryltransferase [Corchorus olitorius]|uniref:Oligosaccaryltransferase n=1 Tax=Corchorus olitorius TaxID=93759 RepID=A0A1R3JQ63_9ROSI|nr:Oligosaccaryltransferase [Corchorus olitorius]